MPEYKLIYFNAAGRAELIRWIFAYSGIPYTDERIEKADWPSRKPSIPGGKVPVLMVDGKPLPQSLAIARYVAKQADLVPQDHLEAAYCDALADTFSEMMTSANKELFAPGNEDEKKKKYDEELYPNVIAPFLTRLSQRLATREWFASDKITWADLFIGLMIGELREKKPEVLKEFPVVEGHVNKVLQLPKIKQWLDSRPKTSS
nr:hematopoietic prostaglandin D synthase-like [Procambarus clarkii]